MKERIYYVSQYDNKVHNINDGEYKLLENDKFAYIGKQYEDGFQVNEEV